MLNLPTPEEFLGGRLTLKTRDGWKLVPYTEDALAQIAESDLGWFLRDERDESKSYKGQVRAHLQREIEKCKAGTRLPWLITTEDDQIVGAISLTDIDLSQKQARIDRVVITRDYRRLGFASAVVQAVMTWAFEEASFDCLKADVPLDDTILPNFCLFLGFRLEVTRKNKTGSNSESPHIVGIFAITREWYFQLPQ